MPLKSDARVLALCPSGNLAHRLREEPLLEGVAVDCAYGSADARRRLHREPYDLVITDPTTPIEEDLAFVQELRQERPGVAHIVLAPSATPEDLVAAMRSQVHAVFTAGFEFLDLVHMVRSALDEEFEGGGIQVLSGKPDWLELRVNCRRLSAERLLHFLSEWQPDILEPMREVVMTGFREIVLNAMEHGAQFDPSQVIDVAAVRTARTIVYYVRDPGAGFSPDDLEHAAFARPGTVPTALEELRESRGLRPGGLGLLLARQVADELILSERGNEVVLIKHLA